MNVQLANVLSDISGMTGQAIIKAILGGERDPRGEIAAHLEGNWQGDLLFVLKQEQEDYEFCQKQMSECDRNSSSISRRWKIAAKTSSCPKRREESVSIKRKATRHGSICARNHSAWQVQTSLGWMASM